MIERLKIKEYGCLQNIDITLGDFNVLIGKNNTGKTTFLRAIEHFYKKDVVFLKKDKSEQYLLEVAYKEFKLHIPHDITMIPYNFIYMFFPLLSLNMSENTTILLESPENGMHYKILKDIVNFLYGLSIGAYLGIPKVQIIFTTYSPYLLDYVQRPEDVYVFYKEENITKIINMSTAKGIKDWNYYFLGELWANWGEDDLVRRATLERNME